MPLLGTSINANWVSNGQAGAPNGPGSAIMFDEPRRHVGLMAAVTSSNGLPPGWEGTFTPQVILEGTMDGMNWAPIATVSLPQIVQNACVGSSAVPVIGVRANLQGFPGGGDFVTTFTLVANVAASDT